MQITPTRDLLFSEDRSSIRLSSDECLQYINYFHLRGTKETIRIKQRLTVVYVVGSRTAYIVYRHTAHNSTVTCKKKCHSHQTWKRHHG